MSNYRSFCRTFCTRPSTFCTPIGQIRLVNPSPIGCKSTTFTRNK
nr:MAG TPA: hypothetical protein [Caudoviricetes sp.]